MAGKGTIQKRGVNSWRLTVACGLDSEGKQIRKIKTISTEYGCEEKTCKDCKKISRCKARGEAETKLALFSEEVDKGLYVEPSKLTFAEFTERWLRDYAEVNLAPKTVAGYKEKLTRILQAIGHLKVEKIKPTHLMEFYANLQEDGVRLDGKSGGLSPRNIRHHHRVIGTILQDAVQWQVIPSNPASRVKPPRVPKKEAACYSEGQAMAMLKALENEPLKHRTAITLALATGVREGELMGFEWQDVDFEENTIEIARSSQYVTGRGTFPKEPKNETSKRIVSVPASVMALLKQHKAAQSRERLKAGDLWQGSQRLFTTWEGKPMYPYTFGSWFPKFLKRHNLPPLPFHGLRHTSATILVGQGLHAKVISERLGHSTISTTMDIYSHFIKKADVEAADKLDALFTTNANQQTNQHVNQ